MPEVNSTSSILDSVKLLLGLAPDYTSFDPIIIMDINSVFGILYQLGIGPESFSISDNMSTWDQYIFDNPPNLDDVRMYVYLRVRMMFDPPANASISEAVNKLISEIEWRLNVSVDYRGGEE